MIGAEFVPSVQEWTKGLPAPVLHDLACRFAETVSHLWVDPRSQAAVDAKRAWLRGEIGDEELGAARSAANDAVGVVAHAAVINTDYSTAEADRDAVAAAWAAMAAALVNATEAASGAAAWVVAASPSSAGALADMIRKAIKTMREATP